MKGIYQWMDAEHTIPLQSNFRIFTSSKQAFPRGTRGFEISLQADWTQLVVWKHFYLPKFTPASLSVNLWKSGVADRKR